MKYCSNCGSRLVTKFVDNEQRERQVCEGCGNVQYRNPRTIVLCMVTYRDSVLVCRRAQEPGRGQWIIPSGFLECGETLEAAAARETHEETGVVVDPRQLELYSITSMPHIEQVAVGFRVEVKTLPALRTNPECLDVAFVAIGDLVKKEMAWLESMGNALNNIAEEVRTGRYNIHLISLKSSEGDFRSRDYCLATV